jgi:hypothetical protein
MIRRVALALVLAAAVLLGGCDVAPPADPCKTVNAEMLATKCVSVQFYALFENRTIPKAIGNYTFGSQTRKLSSTSGVINKHEKVPPGSYVYLYLAPERTDAFGLIACKITARGKQVIDEGNNGGHGAAECSGTVAMK